MNFLIKTVNLPIFNHRGKPVAAAFKGALSCLCLLLFLSSEPLLVTARGHIKDPDYLITGNEDTGDSDRGEIGTGDREEVADSSEDPLNPEDSDSPENPGTPENPSGSETPSVPVNPAEPADSVSPIDPVEDNYVTYTANRVSKGGYSTPIWKQHSIWKKRSSASRHGCGICVTSMALQLSGVSSSPNRVLKQTNRSMRRCQSLKPGQAVKVLKKNHVNVKPVNTRSYSRRQCAAIMKGALDQGKMVMALVRGKPFSNNTHWVLVVGYDKNGQIVVANSSYGNRNCCKKAKKQYHLVNWKQIQKKIVRDSINYSAFLIVG